MSENKLFYWDENEPPIKYRPGTSDESIIQTVLIEKKEYLFPSFKPKLVWDVGANIGVVSIILAKIYPETKILAFEPVKENLELLNFNTAHLPNVEILKCGLGKKTAKVPIFKSTDPVNHGGFSTHIDGVGYDDIDILKASSAVQSHGIPDLIKIDCEGAEFDILSDISAYIHEVKWITGELHGVDDYALLEYLNYRFHLQFSRGFKDVVWHFSALNIGGLGAVSDTSKS